MERIAALNARSVAYVQDSVDVPPVYAPGAESNPVNAAALPGGRSLVEQLRLQEEYDLRNALKESAKQPEPGFRADIGQAGVRAEERAQAPDSVRYADHEAEQPQGRPGTSASNYRTNQIAEQLERGHYDPEELARQEAILRHFQQSNSKMINNER